MTSNLLKLCHKVYIYIYIPHSTALKVAQFLKEVCDIVVLGFSDTSVLINICCYVSFTLK